MSAHDRYNQGHGSVWERVHVCRREGYSTSVVGYHQHDFYEINLILSGNVKILLRNGAVQSFGKCMVLTRPGTPHYITCRPDTLYSRLYLMFTPELVNGYPEWSAVSDVFGKDGTLLQLTDEEISVLAELMQHIESEPSLLRRRLLVFYLLSLVLELTGKKPGTADKAPAFLIEAFSYIEEHYGERLVAAELAQLLNVSRTTLMTAFKRYTDRTLVEYMTHCRVEHALGLLREGRTLEDVAERCGFADAGGLVRGFKRCYGMTPRQYLMQMSQLASQK